MPSSLCRVVCGCGLTIAIFSPTIALRRVLLPALARPIRATRPERKAFFVGTTPLLALRSRPAMPEEEKKEASPPESDKAPEKREPEKEAHAAQRSDLPAGISLAVAAILPTIFF